jgi:hypothetical protein
MNRKIITLCAGQKANEVAYSQFYLEVTLPL